MKAFAIAAVAFALAACAFGAEITSLPGFNGQFPAKMYSGYITVNQTSGRQVYYMFFESFSNPATDPLALWLTGGPGCSGLIAVFSENGPFNMNFTANGTGVELNPYTWANVMNTIYIESPVGVGFSNVPNQSSYSTGDSQTAEDTYEFLQGFYKEFPQFKTNPFWVTGESYGGHYVPEIVNRVLDGNEVVNQTGLFNIPLKGWMVGNPWTDPEHEAWGVVQNWWDRAIIGRDLWNSIQANCDYKDITFWIINNASAGALRTPKQQAAWWNTHLKMAREMGQFRSVDSAACFAALNEATNVQFSAVDIEGVYRDMCVPGVVQHPDQLYNPCSMNQLITYLNRDDVRDAVHASRTNPSNWEPCVAPPQLTYSTYDTQQPVIYVYERALLRRDLNLSVLVYSGDNDAIVPYTGTRMWIERLNRAVVKGNHQWFVDTNGMQVGGWATQYDGFTFTTVRGAGHMVPYMQPARALHMIKTFLANHTL
jgi:serine carboxypeptidase-like clade 2